MVVVNVMLMMQQYSGVFRNTDRTDVMPVFAAAIFRAMTMCCQYLEYCQLQNTGTTCTEYQQSTKYKKLSSFGGRGGRSNCKLSKPSILHSSKYCSEFGFNIAILLRLFLPYCSCKILHLPPQLIFSHKPAVLLLLCLLADAIT